MSDNVTTTIESLTAENAALTTQNDTLTGTNSALLLENKTVKQELEEMTNNFQKSEDNVATLTAEVNELKKTTYDVKDISVALETLDIEKLSSIAQDINQMIYTLQRNSTTEFSPTVAGM